MSEYKANAKRTRKAIFEAFINLLAQKSFEKITVENILSTADVNRSTFYKYFQDKYDLARHKLQALLDLYAEAVKKGKDLSSAESWGLVYKHLCEYKKDYKALLTIETKELNIFTEIINGLCKMYLSTGKTSKNSKIEAYYFADIHYIPMFFLLESETTPSEKEYYLSCTDSLIKLFAETMRIDTHSLYRFVDSQKQHPSMLDSSTG